MMAVLFLLSPLLLLLGTVAGQVVLEEDVCLSVGNATEGNFTVETDPGTYQPNTTYLGKAALDPTEPPRLCPSLLCCCSNQAAVTSFFSFSNWGAVTSFSYSSNRAGVKFFSYFSNWGSCNILFLLLILLHFRQEMDKRCFCRLFVPIS